MQTAEDFTTLLVRSRLHSAEAAQTLNQRWRKEVGAHGQPDFARWLVGNGHLTEYQANLLARGRTEGFFLGSYKILDRIGEGRMAGVYRAVHESSGEAAAVKVLPPSKAKDPLTLARFQRETKLALALNHPSVVRAIEAGESNGVHYLVMEHLDGGTLQELLAERGKLAVREAVRIAFLTALGLQHVHEKGLVHRDLKPGNLMLCPRPAPGESTLRSLVKILDIGLGRKLFDASDRDDPDQWVTADGVTLGTPDYLAPEQARDARTADIRADIYSLGCTLYHMLTGLPPFPDKNPVQKVVRHAKEPPRPIAEVQRDVPAALDNVVAKMLAKAPAQRFAAPIEAAEALKAFLAGVTDWAASPPEATPSKPQGPEPALLPDPGGPSKPPPLPPAKRSPAPAKGETVKEPAAKAPEGIPVHVPPKRPALPPKAPAGADASRPELIDVEAVSPVDLAVEFLRFRSRDLLMLVLGALAGGGLVALVWMIVALFSGGEAPLE